MLYAAYSATRFVVGGDWGAARHHALDILEVERFLHIDVEHEINHAITPITPLAVFSAYWYATMHFIVTWTVLVVLYIRRPALYRPARTALFAATFIALLGYMFYPTAPPRLTGGYIDTVAATSQYGWWPSAADQAQNASTVTNQVAAMPSMHVGWALWVSVVLACLARRRWLKILAFGYVATTTAVVVLTANHWLLDAVAGGASGARAAGGPRAVRTGPPRRPNAGRRHGRRAGGLRPDGGGEPCRVRGARAARGAGRARCTSATRVAQRPVDGADRAATAEQGRLHPWTPTRSRGCWPIRPTSPSGRPLADVVAALLRHGVAVVQAPPGHRQDHARPAGGRVGRSSVASS